MNDYYFNPFNSLVYTLSFREVLINLLVSLICSAIISFLYRWTYKGLNYSTTFANSLILLSMITAVVIMVIGNNLARAFGLVGAMSIIRFRTAVKDAQDIMFIFFALAVGLASGVKLYSLAFIGTFFIGSVFYVLTKLNSVKQKKKVFLLQIHSRSNSSNMSLSFINILKKYCRRYKLINIKTISDTENLFEISYYISLKSENNGQVFVEQLNNYEGITQVNLFFGEE